MNARYGGYIRSSASDQVPAAKHLNKISPPSAWGDVTKIFRLILILVKIEPKNLPLYIKSADV
jgi:hypothetical protein